MSHPPFYYNIEYHACKAWGNLRQEENLFALLHFGPQDRVGESHPAEIQLGLPLPGEDWLEVWRSTESLQINAEAQGLERYRAFCLGRYQAIDSWNFVSEQLPVATAIGSRAEGRLIYFLAARQPGIQIENPRQVSAFHYPPQYGPKSPGFSRATVKNWGGSRHLYISGTASIVGHETRHAGECLSQLRESLENIHAVIEQAHHLHGMACKTIADLDVLRIYIRDPVMAEDSLAQLRELAGPTCRLQLVQGDICRQDLLLELEGLYTGQPAEE